MEPVSEESRGFVPEGAAPGPALAKSKGLLRKRRATWGLDTRRGCSEPSIPRLCLNPGGFPVPVNQMVAKFIRGLSGSLTIFGVPIGTQFLHSCGSQGLQGHLYRCHPLAELSCFYCCHQTAEQLGRAVQRLDSRGPLLTGELAHRGEVDYLGAGPPANQVVSSIQSTRLPHAWRLLVYGGTQCLLGHWSFSTGRGCFHPPMCDQQPKSLQVHS